MGNGFVFAAPEPSYHPLEYHGELLWVPRNAPRGVQFEGENLQIQLGIPCLLLQQPNASRFVVYFHANAEDLGLIYVMLRHLRALLKVHVLAVEYAGYGICSGVASEEKLLADSEAVMSFVRDQLEVPASSLVLMGRSLGGGPAIYLASKYPCAGLVTIATFSSIQAVVGSLAGMVNLLVDKFDNGTRIRAVSCPTLILHGRDDEVVSAMQARTLASACGVDAVTRQPVVLKIRKNVDHNNFDIRRDIVGPILKTFPQFQTGAAVELRAAERLLLVQPEKLASDVLARVPYEPNWTPSRPPFGYCKMRGIYGEEI